MNLTNISSSGDRLAARNQPANANGKLDHYARRCGLGFGRHRLCPLLLGMAVAVLCLAGPALQAFTGPPPPGSGGAQDWLDSWSFNDTNAWTSDLGYPAISFTNLSSSILGDATALVLDSTNAAWLKYNVVETSGTNNLALNQGSLVFWFAPDWTSTNAGGTGPGQWGRLIEVGSYTTNASYGWWSLYLDAAGDNIYFSGQTNNGNQATYLAEPISWGISNYWHMIALTYSSTNSALYLDGNLLTNGTGVTYWPGSNVLTNGFYIGSDSNGVEQAHGMFDDVATYNFQLSATTIASAYFVYGTAFYANPMNRANFQNGPSTPQVTPTFEAITGSGNLLYPTSASGCVTSSNVWITNVVAVLTNNGTMNVTFTIAGGSNSLRYDVFATAILGPTNAPAHQWAWMGRGYTCMTYTITNFPLYSAYLILGTPQDTDGDGLTDAYELLVSHSDPNKADSSGDGMLDGWKVLWGLNPSVNNTVQAGLRANFNYDPVGRLLQVSGDRTEALGADAEGNVFEDSQQ